MFELEITKGKKEVTAVSKERPESFVLTPHKLSWPKLATKEMMNATGHVKEARKRKAYEKKEKIERKKIPWWLSECRRCLRHAIIAASLCFCFLQIHQKQIDKIIFLTQT